MYIEQCELSHLVLSIHVNFLLQQKYLKRNSEVGLNSGFEISYIVLSVL